MSPKFKYFFFLVLVIIGPIFNSYSQIFDGTNLSSSKPYFSKLPYVFDGSESYFITFKTDSAILRELVPVPLNPLKSDELTVVFAKHRIVSPTMLNYNEAYFVTTAGYGLAFGGFIPVLYLDKIEAITPAREIWGYNKVGGDFEFIEEDSLVTIILSRMDALIMKATFVLGETFIPGEQSPMGPVFNLKYIPSAIENAPPDVHQITTSIIADGKTHTMRLGTATLEFFHSYYNPVDKIPIKEITGAGYFKSSFSMVYGDVLYDYLKEKD